MPFIDLLQRTQCRSRTTTARLFHVKISFHFFLNWFSCQLLMIQCWTGRLKKCFSTVITINENDTKLVWKVLVFFFSLDDFHYQSSQVNSNRDDSHTSTPFLIDEWLSSKHRIIHKLKHIILICSLIHTAKNRWFDYQKLFDCCGFGFFESRWGSWSDAYIVFVLYFVV